LRVESRNLRPRSNVYTGKRAKALGLLGAEAKCAERRKMQGSEPLSSQPPKPQSEAEVPILTADDHLKHLLLAETGEPWFSSLARNLKDLIRPQKLPPLQLTSKPVAVKNIWGDYRYGKQAGVSSTAIHVVAVILMFTLAGSKTVREAVVNTAKLVAPAAWTPDMTPKPQKQQGGGGGGDRSPLPASKGRAPKFAERQFVPPQQVVNNSDPKLLMEPTLIGPNDIRLPNVNLPVWGDPNAKIGPYSNGPGSGGGIGSGSGGGIGPGRGPGYGPGEGGGIGGGVYRVGGGVSAPVAIYKIEPEYSKRPARRNSRAPWCSPSSWTSRDCPAASRWSSRSVWGWTRRPSRRSRSGASRLPR